MPGSAQLQPLPLGGALVPPRKISTPAKRGSAAHFQEAGKLPELKERLQDEMDGQWWPMSEEWVLSVLPEADINNSAVDKIVADLYEEEAKRWMFLKVDRPDDAPSSDTSATPAEPSSALSNPVNPTENTLESLNTVSGPATPVLDVACPESDEVPAWVPAFSSPHGTDATLPDVPANDSHRGTAGVKRRREQREKKLYKPFQDLLSAMLRKADRCHCRRVVIQADKLEPHHSNVSGTRLKSSVDLLVLGAMPQLNGLKPEEMASGPEPFEKMTATIADAVLQIEVKTDAAKGETRHHPQLCVYIREQLKKQPNRHFCFFMLLTEVNVRVYLFTRSGAFYSPWLNIHDNPSRFAKIFLGLTTLNAAALGFNPSIVIENKQYVYDHQFVDSKIQGKRFQVFTNEPWVRRYNICGRGTTCWYIVPPTNQEGESRAMDIIVKEAWPSIHRTPTEADFLRKAKGLYGVGQMYEEDVASEEDNLQTVSDIAKVPETFDAQNGRYINRKRVRLFLQAYRGDVSKFRKRSQFVQAIIDALKGHRRLLLRRRILHRDISLANVVLGEIGCKVGNRGRIIDLDLAVEQTDDGSGIEGTRDVRTGTLQFLSVNLLHGNKREHTYLDDLQSFFWVIVVVCLTRESDDPTKKWFDNDALLNSWAGTEDSTARAQKESFLNEFKNGGRPDYSLAPYMQIFDDFIQELGELCVEWALKQEENEGFYTARRARAERKLNRRKKRSGGLQASIDQPTAPNKPQELVVEPTIIPPKVITADYDEFLEILGRLEQAVLAEEEKDEKEDEKEKNAKATPDPKQGPEVSANASQPSFAVQEDVFGRIVSTQPGPSASIPRHHAVAQPSKVQASRAPKRNSASIEGGPAPAPTSKRPSHSRWHSAPEGA